MKLTISKKITIAISIVALCALMAILYSSTLMRQQSKNAAFLEEGVLPLVNISDRVSGHVSGVTNVFQEFSLTGSEAVLNEYYASLEALKNQVQEQHDFILSQADINLNALADQMRVAIENAIKAADNDITHTRSLYALVDEIKEQLAIILGNTDIIYFSMFDNIYEAIEENRPADLGWMTVIHYGGDLFDNVNFFELALNAAMGDLLTADLSGMDGSLDIMIRSVETISPHITDAENSALLEEIRENLAKIEENNNTFKEYLYSIRTVRSTTQASISAVVNQINALNEVVQENLRSTISETSAKLSNAMIISIVMAFVLIAVCAVSIVFLRLGVIKNLHSFVSATNRLTSGEGDLTSTIKVTTSDELADLATYFNRFIKNVHDIVAETKVAAESVAAGNNQLATTMEQLSSTFNEQGEEIAVLVDNISKVRVSSTENMSELSRNQGFMADTADKTGEGNKELSKALEKINAINTQTDVLADTVNKLTGSIEDIKAILRIINDIADQTNMLALNAAIEAARAGDAGRGFAVVADEVRALAERTQNATSQINTIILELSDDSNQASKEMAHSSDLVAEGVENINATNITFTEIVKNIAVVTSGINSITDSIGVQNDTIVVLDKNAKNISDGVDKNNKAVMEVVNTIEHLGQRAEKLKILVSQFKTD